MAVRYSVYIRKKQCRKLLQNSNEAKRRKSVNQQILMKKESIFLSVNQVEKKMLYSNGPN